MTEEIEAVIDSEVGGEQELPKGWYRTTVGEAYTIVGGGTPSTEQASFWQGDTPWISSADIDEKGGITLRRFITEAAIDSSATNPVPEGTVIVVTRVGLGKVAVAPTRLCFSQDSQGLLGDAEVLDTRFALHFLSTAARTFKSISRGTTISGITKKQLAELVIPLPPLEEQRRIVEKLEALLSDLEASREGLEKALAKLKRYRQSVLKAAVEGELSREWREARKGRLEPASELLKRILEERRKRWEEAELAKMKAKGKVPLDDKWKARYVEPEGVDSSYLPELPGGWDWAVLNQFSWDCGYGTSEKCTYDNEGHPVLRIPNIANGRISLEDMKFAASTAVLDVAESLEFGDLLIIRTNGSKDLIGRASAVVEKLKKPHFFASYLIRFRLVANPKLLAWVNAIWPSRPVRNWIESRAASSAGQHNISMSTLKVLPVPVPPTAEQTYIVSEVDRLLSEADKAQEAIQASLKRCERLRQAVLREAFAGRLVPQDSADEPASALLARVRARRAEAGKPGSGRRGKPT